MKPFNDPIESLKAQVSRELRTKLDPRIKAALQVTGAGGLLYLLSEILIRFGAAS